MIIILNILISNTDKTSHKYKSKLTRNTHIFPSIASTRHRYAPPNNVRSSISPHLTRLNQRNQIISVSKPPQIWLSVPNATRPSTSPRGRRPWDATGTRAAWSAPNATRFSTPASTLSTTTNLTAIIPVMRLCSVQEVSDTEEARATSGTRNEYDRVCVLYDWIDCNRNILEIKVLIVLKFIGAVQFGFVGNR